MSKVEGVRHAYDCWAVVYDHDKNPLQALEGPAVRGACGDVDGLSVLDLGFGTGRHALWLAASGAHVTAVNFSDAITQLTRATSSVTTFASSFSAVANNQSV